MTHVFRVVLVNERGERVLDTLVKPQFKDIAMKGGLRQDLHRIAKAKGESIETVRARVLDLIKGKKVVGYHLPQKLADFGILNKVASVQKPGQSDVTDVKKAQPKEVPDFNSDSDSPKVRAPNQLSRDDMVQPQIAPVQAPKQVSMIQETYDCAKIFNTTMTGNQMPIGTLCDTYLNLVYKKKSGPAFAVS